MSVNHGLTQAKDIVWRCSGKE